MLLIQSPEIYWLIRLSEMSFKFGPKKYRFGQYWENDAENRRSKMSELTQFLRLAKQTVLFDFGPPCFCCCREFAALSRPSNWSSCEQRSLLYTLCLLLPPILGRPLFKARLHVTNTHRPKSTFHENTGKQKPDISNAFQWPSIWSQPSAGWW